MKIKIISTLLLFHLFTFNVLSAKDEINLNQKSIPSIFQSFIQKIAYDKIGNSSPAIAFKQISPRVLKVMLSYDLKDSVQQDDFQVNIYPNFKPSFNWSPHLSPTDDYIIAQHSFRSPAMIVADANKQLVIIPDLDIMLSEGQELKQPKWYMDMDAPKNTLTIGMSNYKVKEHVLYQRAKGTIYRKGKVEFGFYIMAQDNKAELADPFRAPLDFLWKNWGEKLYQQGEPMKGDLDVYNKYTYDWAFDKWKDAVWQEFELNEKKVGAPVFIVNVTQSPNYPGEVNEREFRSIWNQAWFSSLRSASGLYRYAKRTNNKEWMDKANLTKELALAFPQKNGFFNGLIATEMEQVVKDGKPYNRSKGWANYYWGNSDRNPFTEEAVFAPYHILDMSWTCLLMLNWYDELEKDQRLLDYSVNYANALLKLQDTNGFFPAWLHRITMQPMGVLDDSPETSMSVTFLLKLHEVTKDKKYYDAALKAMNAVTGDIISTGRWEDFETYWSCCSYGNTTLIGKKVERNNMYKQCNFSMYWTAEALFNCYKITKEKKYLELGQRCLDEMLMTQASWQPPYMYVKVFGGFGVMNSDGEWNDSRQCLFAELTVQYGQELNNKEYIQRGLAALRSSFLMMYCPENQKSKEQWEKKWPFFNENDYGFMMENYGHGGYTSPDGTGIGEFTIYDWGNGAATEAYNRMVDHFGKEFINNK